MADSRTSDPLHDLELLIRSRYGLIVLDTVEEERAATIVRLLGDHLGLPLFTWSRSRGLRRDGQEAGVYGTTDPSQALAHIDSARLPALYHLAGFGPLLADAGIAERLRELAGSFGERQGALLLSGESLELPEPLRRLAASVRLPEPGLDEFRALLTHVLRDVSKRQRVEHAMDPVERDRLLSGLQGLTLLEAEKVLTRAIVEDGRLTPDDLGHVLAAKKEIVEREGVLEYYPREESMAEVADLAGLKAWLARRRDIIARPEQAAQFGLTFPRGLLLVGVPGCGKSLCAKAVATEWGLPLLRLDPGALYNKYIGETEANFRRAMRTAERISPVVLWIDEIEKAFATDGQDGGVSQRVLGTFLSWMQERRGDVFVVATANDVAKLPAEFLRKGRFDEIFFVDLPDAPSRRAILGIHLRRRQRDPATFDLPALEAATDGFSGAELEQAVVSALYTVFADGRDLTTDALLAEIAATSPLSRVMAERVTALRQWAVGRTVPAN